MRRLEGWSRKQVDALSCCRGRFVSILARTPSRLAGSRSWPFRGSLHGVCLKVVTFSYFINWHNPNRSKVSFWSLAWFEVRECSDSEVVMPMRFYAPQSKALGLLWWPPMWPARSTIKRYLARGHGNSGRNSVRKRKKQKESQTERLFSLPFCSVICLSSKLIPNRRRIQYQYSLYSIPVQSIGYTINVHC